MLLLFMPRGSGVFEIFPFKYWKEGYRPLADEYGLVHGWSQNDHAKSLRRRLLLSLISQEACMHWARCREFARRDDVEVDAAALDAVVAFARRSL